MKKFSKIYKPRCSPLQKLYKELNLSTNKDMNMALLIVQIVALDTLL